MKVYAVDFDGTLCTNAYPKIGQPKYKIIDYIKEIQRQGNKTILWTCRSGKQLEEAVVWCEEKGLEFDAVNENLPELIEKYGNDSRKISANQYIDDKSVNVEEIEKMKEVRGLKAEIRADGLHISGYVNVPGRESRPVITPRGRVVEIIEQRAFEKALAKAENIDLLVDHERRVASTNEGTLELKEDAVGLRAHTVITDELVIDAAKKGKLRGWSFNMFKVKDEIEERADKLPLRRVKEFLMSEITLAINKLPVYSSTSIEIRAEEEEEMEQRAVIEEIQVIDRREKEKKVDYSELENRVPKLMEEE